MTIRYITDLTQRCHDERENHPNEHANRMICGYCSREQNYRPVRDYRVFAIRNKLTVTLPFRMTATSVALASLRELVMDSGREAKVRPLPSSFSPIASTIPTSFPPHLIILDAAESAGV